MKPYRDDENRIFKNHIPLEIHPLRPFKIFFQEYFVFNFLRQKALLFLMKTPEIHTTKKKKQTYNTFWFFDNKLVGNQKNKK